MIVLDTHIWLWWVNGDDTLLGAQRKQRIESCDQAAVSAISCFEIAWLERHGRITLPYDRDSWFDKALANSGITLLPVTPHVAGAAVDLPEHHSDPQDRIIIATAIAHDACLMSADRKFPLYRELEGRLL